MTNEAIAPASPDAGDWLALCYLGRSGHLDGAPYEVSGSARMTYDEFVEHVQERLDRLAMKGHRRVMITRIFGKMIDMEQGRGFDVFAKDAAKPFCETMHVGTEKQGSMYVPILRDADGTEIDRGPARWGRTAARSVAVSEWKRRRGARTRSPIEHSYNQGWAA